MTGPGPARRAQVAATEISRLARTLDDLRAGLRERTTPSVEIARRGARLRAQLLAVASACGDIGPSLVLSQLPREWRTQAEVDGRDVVIWLPVGSRTVRVTIAPTAQGWGVEVRDALVGAAQHADMKVAARNAIINATPAKGPGPITITAALQQLGLAPVEVA